jgi:hypothetical protein
MSLDGKTVAYGITFRGLYVWNSQVTKGISGGTYPEALSPDGHQLIFFNLNLRIRDLISNTESIIGNPSQIIFRSFRQNARFTPDARFLVYVSATSNSVMDTNIFIADIYVHDFGTGTDQLISQTFDSGFSPSGLSDSPTISPDGRFVTYRSFARNIIPTITNGLAQIYLYDRQCGKTTLMGANSFSGIANHRAFSPAFSGDSQSVVFQSFASDLTAALDLNQQADVFSWKLVTGNPIPLFVGQLVYAPTSGQSPTLTWPAIAGKTYQVQYKDDLRDPLWQPMTGTVTIVGDHGFATDLAPNPNQRFYRIKAF